MTFPLTRAEAKKVTGALTTHRYRQPDWHPIALKLMAWGKEQDDCSAERGNGQREPDSAS